MGFYTEHFLSNTAYTDRCFCIYRFTSIDLHVNTVPVVKENTDIDSVHDMHEFEVLFRLVFHQVMKPSNLLISFLV